MGDEGKYNINRIGSATRFYWDKNEQKCILFKYTRKGGNANNFESEEECLTECKGKGTDTKDDGNMETDDILLTLPDCTDEQINNGEIENCTQNDKLLL